eukprot:TRINITY_DN904_c0_g1_i2.p1 TRINITY_DN904_c0_g1~~TRINITY_DN904_c0_g1_i2.p1  ORF type:complete len:376 (+),score=44.33 TRINITY_DN904_c0_g1_i2:104-1231(+)
MIDIIEYTMEGKSEAIENIIKADERLKAWIISIKAEGLEDKNKLCSIASYLKNLENYHDYNIFKDVLSLAPSFSFASTYGLVKTIDLFAAIADLRVKRDLASIDSENFYFAKAIDFGKALISIENSLKTSANLARYPPIEMWIKKNVFASNDGIPLNPNPVPSDGLPFCWMNYDIEDQYLKAIKNSSQTIANLSHYMNSGIHHPPYPLRFIGSPSNEIPSISSIPYSMPQPFAYNSTVGESSRIPAFKKHKAELPTIPYSFPKQRQPVINNMFSLPKQPQPIINNMFVPQPYFAPKQPHSIINNMFGPQPYSAPKQPHSIINNMFGPQPANKRYSNVNYTDQPRTTHPDSHVKKVSPSGLIKHLPVKRRSSEHKN